MSKTPQAAAPAKAVDTPPAKAVDTPPATRRYVAAFGLMVHPFKGTRFDIGVPGEAVDGDSWVECQVQAGKLVPVEAK